MKLKEAKAALGALVPKASQYSILKYIRTGYIDRGRWSDVLVQEFVSQIPGDGELPHRWRHNDLDSFLSEYGDRGSILWAKSFNSHLLMIHGHHILRIWTDVKDSCWVDLHPTVGTRPVIAAHMDCDNVPENSRKSKPFKHRAKIRTKEDMNIIAAEVKMIWGLKC